MSKPSISMLITVLTFGMIIFSPSSQGAISLDRTRVIMDANNKSVSLTITNESQRLPYLAQGWIENERGEKVNTPLTVLPPVQRLEAGDKSQIKIQSLPAVRLLSQDKETLFYFNLREIPPRSEQPNTLQIALQTKIKLFYRPAALQLSPTEFTTVLQRNVTLVREGDHYRFHNPTGYYLTLIDASRHQGDNTLEGFSPVMVSPHDSVEIGGSAGALGSAPVVQYVNDFGGRSTLIFRCEEGTCKVVGDA
ncbi:fimbria/pilus periplasmic chaperone [Pseudomonas graminis]